MNTRRLLRAPLKGHEGSVLCLQFDADPEEDLIVSGSSDSNVILWRFSTGEIIQRLTKAHSESVLNVKFDKRILVTCSKDKSIKIFNRRPLKYGDLGYPNGVNPVPIRIRDNRYGNPTDDLPIIAPYTMIGRLDGHGAAVNAVQIHGNEVVSASGDRNIKVWDWAKQVCTRTVVGHTKGIACVQYDGRRIKWPAFGLTATWSGPCRRGSVTPAWLERNLPYLPVSAKTQLAMALLDHLPTSVVAQIAERLHPRLYINFIQYLPPEVCLKILGYLDPVSLLGVAQSCREWYSLALDRKLWEK
ncbi:hypothetical protein BN1723_017152, partial [Verticillium longisporum]